MFMFIVYHRCNDFVTVTNIIPQQQQQQNEMHINWMFAENEGIIKFVLWSNANNFVIGIDFMDNISQLWAEAFELSTQYVWILPKTFNVR